MRTLSDIMANKNWKRYCRRFVATELSMKAHLSSIKFVLTPSEFESNNMIIIDRGRRVDERTAVLIENGIYKGYCFYDLNYQINNVEVLKNILIPMQNNRDTRNIIQSHIRRSKSLKIKNF